MQTPDPTPWLLQRSRPLAERLAPAPAECLAHVQRVGQAEGSDIRPQAVPVSGAMAADVAEALAELPPPVLAALNGPLLGIHLARDLGCSAITDVVRWQDRTLGAVVLLDVEALAGRSANEWASWKEGGPFGAPEPSPLRVTIADPEDDVRRNAIQFLLLHEFGHVLSAGSGFLPDWWLHPTQLAPAEAYPFLRLSWRVSEAGTIVPRPGHDFALRRQLAYYGTARLGLEQTPQLYTDWAATSFASLYGSINAYDDYAECLALYVHTVLMRRPYGVRMGGGGQALSDAASVARRCAEKFDFVAQRLGCALDPQRGASKSRIW